MITRITRGTLRPNTEARVFEILRTAATSTPSVPGMVSMSISRRIDPAGIRLVAITQWETMASMVAQLGDNSNQPAWPPGLADCVAESEVELLETVVSSFQELADLVPAG